MPAAAAKPNTANAHSPTDLLSDGFPSGAVLGTVGSHQPPFSAVIRRFRASTLPSELASKIHRRVSRPLPLASASFALTSASSAETFWIIACHVPCREVLPQ